MPDSNEKLRVNDSRSISSFLGIAGVGAAVFAGGWHLLNNAGLREAMSGGVKGVTNVDMRAAAAKGILRQRQEDFIRPGFEAAFEANQKKFAEFGSKETLHRVNKALDTALNPKSSRIDYILKRNKQKLDKAREDLARATTPRDKERLLQRVAGKERIEKHFMSKAKQLVVDANDSLNKTLKPYLAGTDLGSLKNTKETFLAVYKSLAKTNPSEAAKLYNTVSMMSEMAASGKTISANSRIGSKFKKRGLTAVSKSRRLGFLEAGGYLEGLSKKQVKALSSSAGFRVYSRQTAGGEMAFVSFGTSNRIWSLGEAGSKSISSVYEHVGSGGGILSGMLVKKAGGQFEEVKGSTYVLSKIAETAEMAGKAISKEDEEILSALYAHRTSNTAALWQAHGTNSPLRGFATNRALVEEMVLDRGFMHNTEAVSELSSKLANQGYVPAAGGSAIETVYKMFGFDEKGQKIATGLGAETYKFNVWDEASGWLPKEMKMADWLMQHHGKFKDQFELYRAHMKMDYLVSSAEEGDKFFQPLSKTQAKLRVNAGVLSNKQFQDFRELSALAQELKGNVKSFKETDILDALTGGKVSQKLLKNLGISEGSVIDRTKAAAIAKQFAKMGQVGVEDLHYIANIGAGQALGSKEFMQRINSIEFASVFDVDDFSSDIVEKINRAKPGETIEIKNLKPGQILGRKDNRSIRLAKDGTRKYRAEIMKTEKGYKVIAYGQHAHREYMSKTARSFTGAGENLDRRLVVMGDLRGGLSHAKELMSTIGGKKYQDTMEAVTALLSGGKSLDLLYGEDILSNAPSYVKTMAVKSMEQTKKTGKYVPLMIQSYFSLWAAGAAHIGSKAKGDILHAQMMRNMGLDFMIPKYFAKMTSLNKEGLQLALKMTEAYQTGTDAVGDLIKTQVSNVNELREVLGKGIASEEYAGGFKYKSRKGLIDEVRKMYGDTDPKISKLLDSIKDQEYYYMPGARSGLQEKIAAAAKEGAASQRPLYSTKLEQKIMDVARAEESLQLSLEKGDAAGVRSSLVKLKKAQREYATTPGIGLTGKRSILRDLGPTEGGTRFTIHSNITAKQFESVAEVGEVGLIDLGFNQEEIAKIKTAAKKAGGVTDVSGVLYGTRWPITSGGFYKLKFNQDIMDKTIRTTTLMDQLSMIDRDKDAMDAVFFRGKGLAGAELTQEQIKTIFERQKQLLKTAEPLMFQFKSAFDYTKSDVKGMPSYFNSAGFADLLKDQGITDFKDVNKWKEVGTIQKQYDDMLSSITGGKADKQLMEEFTQFETDYGHMFYKNKDKAMRRLRSAEAFSHMKLFEQTFVRKIGGKGIIPQTTNMTRLMDVLAQRGGITEMGDKARTQIQLLGEALFQFPIHSLKHADSASMLNFAQMTDRAMQELKKGNVDKYFEELGSSSFFREKLIKPDLLKRKDLTKAKVDAIMKDEELYRKASKDYFNKYYSELSTALKTAAGAGPEEFNEIVRGVEGFYSKTGNLGYMNKRMAAMAAHTLVPEEIISKAGMAKKDVALDVAKTTLKKHPAVAISVGGGVAALALIGMLQSPSDTSPLISPTAADKEAMSKKRPTSPADALGMPREPSFLDNLKRATGGRFASEGTVSYDTNGEQLGKQIQQKLGSNDVKVNIMNPYDSRTSIRTRRRISGEQQ